MAVNTCEDIPPPPPPPPPPHTHVHMHTHTFSSCMVVNILWYIKPHCLVPWEWKHKGTMYPPQPPPPQPPPSPYRLPYSLVPWGWIYDVTIYSFLLPPSHSTALFSSMELIYTSTMQPPSPSSSMEVHRWFHDIPPNHTHTIKFHGNIWYHMYRFPSSIGVNT